VRVDWQVGVGRRVVDQSANAFGTHVEGIWYDVRWSGAQLCGASSKVGGIYRFGVDVPFGECFGSASFRESIGWSSSSVRICV